jgi:hypothetical protein
MSRSRPIQIPARTAALTLVGWFCLLAECQGQGTLTFTFEGAPGGTRQNVGTYTESGMLFTPRAPGSLFLNGGGTPGYPDNGTGYLEVPDAFVGGGGMSFAFTATSSIHQFNLVSFDAAEYSSLGAQTITVIGYRDDIMGLQVTQTFTLDGINDGTGPLQDFQTFQLDPSFIHLGRVDFLNARFSFDNAVISGVPEPSSGALMLLGVACALGCRRHRRTRERIRP